MNRVMIDVRFVCRVNIAQKVEAKSSMRGDITGRAMTTLAGVPTATQLPYDPRASPLCGRSVKT